MTGPTDQPGVRRRARRTGRVLAAKLPARWGRRQRAKNTAIYLLARAAAGALRRLHIERLPLAAQSLGGLVWILSPAHRRRSDENLRLAFPDLEPRARRRLTRRSFVHLARCAIEVLRWDRLRDSPLLPGMDEEQRRVFREALAEGKGAVLVSGHIGNWELIPPIVTRAGFPMSVVAKPAYDPRLTRWIHRLRGRGGVEVLWRGDAGLTRSLLRVFKRGGILGLVIDQDTDVRGVHVPFFGRQAHTPNAAATFALQLGAPVLVCWMERAGRANVFHAERLPLPAETSREEAVRALTAAMTARLEQAIRAAPEQWVWMHDRWKRAPYDPELRPEHLPATEAAPPGAEPAAR